MAELHEKSMGMGWVVAPATTKKQDNKWQTISDYNVHMYSQWAGIALQMCIVKVGAPLPS